MFEEAAPARGCEPGPPFIEYDEWASHPVAITKYPRRRSFQADSRDTHLPAFPPSAAPASAPSAPSAEEPDDHEQQDRADRSVNDLRKKPRTEMDSQLWKYQARDEGSRYSHDEIADQAQTRTHDDLAREPTGRDAHSQDDEKAFTGYVHFHALASELRNSRVDPE
jgi:hypothetical protein